MGKRGPKPKDPSEVRRARTPVMSTDAEKWRLDRAAEADDMTTSDMLRSLGLARADKLKIPAEPPPPPKRKARAAKQV